MIVMTVGLAFSYSQTKGPEIKFDNIEHDYGKILENGGKANHIFWFTNTGDEDLILTRVQPGCGCTASDWTKTPVAPGDKGMVSAAYDPLGRPGPFRKSIMVVSNSKTSGTLSLFIKGDVTPRTKDYTDTFRVHLGDLLIERNNPVFHSLKHDEIRNDTIRFYNKSDMEMQLSIKDMPLHINATLSTSKIKPAERGFVVLRYNAGLVKEAGNRNDRITIQTNDPKQEQKILFITADILEKPVELTPEMRFPFRMGNILTTRNGVSFANILNTESRIDSLQLYNDAQIAIKIDYQKPAKHLKASLSSNLIPPGKTVTLYITFDASKVDGFGQMFGDRLMLQTDDTVQPLKIIYISAVVKEDFSKLTPSQLANAPVIEFENKEFDFGTKPSGDKIPHSFVFKNTGKSDLVIRKVNASCGCTATNPEKTIIKPGESSKIDTSFDTKGRSGDQIKTITVVTNDPKNPEVMLQIKGKLE